MEGELTSESIMATQPENLKINLFPHQLAAIHKIETMESEKEIEIDSSIKNFSIGIFADKVGAGKTLTMIAVILRDKMRWNLNLPYIQKIESLLAGQRIKTTKAKEYKRIHPTVVLVSNSIMHQWERELQNNTNLKYKKIITNRHIEELEKCSETVTEYDILLIVPTMYNNVMKVFTGCIWKRFIYDEASNVKVTLMGECMANFTWLITATPNGLQLFHRSTKSNYIRSLIPAPNSYYWDRPLKEYDGLIVKNRDEFIDESIQLPPTVYNYHRCHDVLYKTVKKFVNQNILTMISAGNIEGAIVALGGNKTSNIYELIKNKKLEECEEIESKVRIYKIRGDEERIKEWSEKLVIVNRQINDLHNRINDVLGGQCNICLENIDKPVMDTNCQNVFCGGCIMEGLKNKKTCPLCRSYIEPSSLIYIKDKKDEESSDDENKNAKNKLISKPEVVVKIIKDKPNGKFLIYSMYDSTINTAIKFLNENGIEHGVIKGSCGQRYNILQRFREGNLNVILLNSTMEAAGINLQTASDIIIYHKMGGSTETQIIGRANRQGRVGELNVHYLLVESEEI